MKTRVFPLVLLVYVLLLAAPAQGEDALEVSPSAVRQTISKSLPYLETAGTEWIEKKKCISCHRISFMTWGFREASRHGFEIDASKLQERLTWAFDSTIAPPDDSKPAACSKNSDGVGQLLMGHSAAPFAYSAEQTAQLVAALIKAQREDGSWKPEGQLPGQKRPLAETTQVSTTWDAIALGLIPSTPAVRQARQKALDYLAAAEPGKSTEWYAASLILQHQEKNLEKTAELAAQLKKLQQPDGGFGWLAADPSDALGTGQALYALLLAEPRADSPAVLQATRFLLSTQQSEGSWQVKGTKQGRKDRIEETACYWGTAWATIALLQALPPPAAPSP